jgi:alkylhydroperoxidase domain protein
MTDHVITHPDNGPPQVFTQEELDWLPWLEPVSAETLSDTQKTALVDTARIKSAYFRLLARDPAILEARTRTDKEIFYNAKGGLPRAERELAATATSRLNGCIYCASVHSRFASVHSKRQDDVQRLLDEGIGVDIDERWNAIIAAATALSVTPAAFSAEHVARLRAAGLDDPAISDLIHGAAFFNWANRLMLSLGEPQKTPPVQ